MQDPSTDAAVVRDLATQGLQVQTVEGHPFVVLADGQTTDSLEAFLPRPLRRKAEVHFAETLSFAQYVNRFATPSLLVTADPDTHSAAAVLDYHEDGPTGAPSWRDHKATLKLKLAPEWQTWTGSDKRQFGQVEFAEFLEQNLIDIAEPDAAKLQEAVLKMQVNRSVRVSSATSLETGEIAFTYEDLENKSKGTAKLPRKLVLGLPVYKHGARYRIDARLSYRLNDGKLTFFYVLQRPEKIAEAAFDGVLAELTTAFGSRPYIGTTQGR